MGHDTTVYASPLVAPTPSQFDYEDGPEDIVPGIDQMIDESRFIEDVQQRQVSVQMLQSIKAATSAEVAPAGQGDSIPRHRRTPLMLRLLPVPCPTSNSVSRSAQCFVWAQR